MTTIREDNLTYADGRSVNGQVVVSWLPFQTAGMAVAGGMEIFQIIAGLVDISLYANTTAQPTGTYYTAVFQLEEGALSTEYWIVPDANQVTLGQVRVLFPPAPSVLISAQQLTSSGAQFGQFLGWNGSHWVPMNVTTIGIGYVATTTQVIAGIGLTGGGALSANITISGVVFGPSGANHAIGMVPDPGAALGGTRYLREDATWAIPSGAGGGMADPTTILGDLIVRGAAAPIRLGVGTDGQVLTANSAAPLGINWATPAPAGIASVFGRTTPAIVAQAGDYTAAQVTGAVPNTVAVLAGTGMTGGGALTGNVTLNANVASVFGRTGGIIAAAGDYTAAMVTNAVDQSQLYSNPSWLTSILWGIISGAPTFLIDPTSAKGDLIVHGTTTTRLGVGTDGQVLTADSTEVLGVKWAGGGGVFTPYSLIGAQNGTNTVFTVSAVLTSFQLFRNGLYQSAPGDYTYTSSGGITTVTFVLAPGATDLLAFWGQSGVSGIPGVFSPRAISGAQNGSNTVFTVSALLTVFQLFRNGILQVSPGDYTYIISGGAIIVTFVVPPGSVDLLAVWGD